MRDWIIEDPVPGRRAIFLDRDGVINVDKHFVHRVEDITFIPGALQAIARFSKLDFNIIVISNQSGIGRGHFSSTDFSTITNYLIDQVTEHGGHIDAVYYCPHHPEAAQGAYKLDCECRKPKPGLFRNAASDFEMPASALIHSWAFGDRPSDIIAATRAGILGNVLVRDEATGKGGRGAGEDEMSPLYTVTSLADAWSLAYQADRAYQVKRMYDRFVFGAPGQEIPGQLQTLDRAADAIIHSVKNGGMVFVCGNGGSAADAQHLEAELAGKFELKRKGLPVISLTTNTSSITAIGNDFGYDEVFIRQLEAYHRSPHDLLIAITTSGTSRNVIKAVQYARENNLKVIGFSGRRPDSDTALHLEKLSDICLIGHSDNTAVIQHGHELFLHLIAGLVEKQLT